jgi:hypothetical protein
MTATDGPSPSLESVQRALRGQGNPCADCLSRNPATAERCRACGTALPGSYGPGARLWGELARQIERATRAQLHRRVLGLGVITVSGSLALLLSGWATGSPGLGGLVFGGVTLLAALGIALYWLAYTRSRELSSVRYVLLAWQQGPAQGRVALAPNPKGPERRGRGVSPSPGDRPVRTKS